MGELVTRTETYSAADTGAHDIFGVPDISPPKHVRRGSYVPLIGWLPRYSPAKALLCLITAAAQIDHRRVEQEVTEINALVGRARTLRKMSPRRIEAMRAEIEPRLSAEKINDLVEKASRTFRRRGKHNARRAASAFMHACDILFADGVLAPSEKSFIKSLIVYLNIPPSEAREYIAVLGSKNRF
jgi:tellurite resistance protein